MNDYDHIKAMHLWREFTIMESLGYRYDVNTRTFILREENIHSRRFV